MRQCRQVTYIFVLRIGGTIDGNIIEAELEDMPEDLLDVQDFEEAMEDLIQKTEKDS